MSAKELKMRDYMFLKLRVVIQIEYTANKLSNFESAEAMV